MSKVAFSLTDADIRRWAESDTVYRRGLAYFKQGRVNDLEYDEIEESWDAKVTGSDLYDVHIEFHENSIGVYCDCLAFQTYDMCKHTVAVFFAIKERHEKDNLFLGPFYESEDEEEQTTNNSHLAEQLIRNSMNTNDIVNLTGGRVKQPLQLEYICKIEYAGPYINKNFLSLELKVGVNRAYVVKNIYEFLTKIESRIPIDFTINFSYDPNEHYVVEEDLEILQILQTIRSGEDFLLSGNHNFGRKNNRSIIIPPFVADILIPKLQGKKVTFEEGRRSYKQIEISKSEELPLTFELAKDSNKNLFSLDFERLQNITYFQDYGWLFRKGVFYKLTGEQNQALSGLGHFMNPLNSDRTLSITMEQIEPFVSHVLPKLKSIATIEMDDHVSNQLSSFPLKAKMYLDLNEGRLTIDLQFYYDDITIHPLHEDGHEKDVILIRDVEKERQLMEVIEVFPIMVDGDDYFIEAEEDLYEFLYEAVPKLQDLDYTEIYMTQGVRSLLYSENQSAFTSVDISSSGNFLEINFDIEGIDGKEIQKVLQSIVEKKRYYRLPNGAFLPLEQEEFQAINELVSELKIPKSQLKGETMHVPLYRGLQIDELMGDESLAGAKLGKKFRRLIQQLKNPDTVDFEVPDTLNATLRDYQEFGFQWLKTLSHYGLGGILADDMGLGKTLQSIAYLLSEKNNKEVKPALIVAPASLVYNWKSEFAKFAADMEVEVVYGSPDERRKQLGVGAADVYITSYPSLRQDIEFYVKLEFGTMILDEAQAIKNHLTKTAKAVKSIQAAKRFALSGTPIENSLDELWSIFDCILPGFFPNKRAFNNLPQERIAKMVRPFILRRLKKDVLKELPDKIETVHHSELTKQQKELYLGYLERIQSETKESLLTEGFEKSRIKILAGLTRLRQLCCHPSLFVEDYKGKSGKFEQLMELLETVLENKKRVLVFSQFTSMLEVIREKLAEMKIAHFYIDGQTPSKDRVEMSERFNQGENDIFLISLKAGGTGLNLTGADTVILYDLWWNPAIEEQAAGRAHRIGQKQVVQVMKLITRGTIEEKIYELQQKKKELIEQVIQPGESQLSSLSEKELLELLEM